ncbi:hypothetical protein N7527_007857 [Penicillium freii]|nr:hypothetical protein N7527_007857 [Penicillium freii]
MRVRHPQDTVTGSAVVTLPKNPKIERRLMIAQRNAEQAYYYSYSYQCVLRERCVSSGGTQTIECLSKGKATCLSRGKNQSNSEEKANYEVGKIAS